jgi:glutamate synthase domain-containing protein 3
MSGGIAYVLDPDGSFAARCNQDLVGLGVMEDPGEADEVRDLVAEHLERTASPVAAALLEDWDAARARLVRVMPTDYERVLQERAEAETADEPDEPDGSDDVYTGSSSNGVAERAPREQVGA